MTVLVLPSPAIAIFLVVFCCVLLLLGTWERVVCFRARRWPVAQGTIDKACVQKVSGKRTRWIARLDYSYSVQNKRYTGRHSQSHLDQEDAEEYVRDLSGKAILVHYSTRWPVFSIAMEDDVKALLLTRPQAPLHNPPFGPWEFADAPLWKKLISYPLMLFALAGFFLSLYVHIWSWLGRIVLPDSWLFLMHLGISVPFFASIVLFPRERRRIPKSELSRSFVFKTMKLVFYYAIANFAVFILSLVFSHNQPTPLQQWRGFSGHWMVFYLWSCGFLYYAVKPMRYPLT